MSQRQKEKNIYHCSYMACIKEFPSIVLLLFLFFSLIPTSYSETAPTLKEQRQQYLDAQKALKQGKTRTFFTLSSNLQNYPLYPYLRYNYLRPRLHKVKVSEVKEFIQTHPDFISTEALRTHWLKQLAKQKKWQIFLDNYSPQKDPVLRCQQLQARIETANQTYLLEDTRSLWLTGKSLPSQCNQAFKLLEKSELMTDELAWQRIRLAMDNGNTGLANYLNRFLGDEHKLWAKRWISIHHNPSSGTRNPKYEDTALAREILLYGIKRLARQNINSTLKNWPPLQKKYSFTPKEIDDVDLVLTVQAAAKKHPKATALLDNLNPAMDSDEIFHWRLRTALKNKDWQKLYEWTKGSPPDIEAVKYRWLYWRGRALEELGYPDKAQEAYALIADQRDYYGFLAADKLGQEYEMNNYPLPDDPEAKNKVARMPGIRRARELHILYGDYRARREWQHALRRMTNYQKQMAARIASDWDWHDRAIFTMGSAHAYDDLVLRFPITYRSEIIEYAAKRNLSAGWIFALMRSESAFIEKVKSPAGALGLMQVMPATGKLTAKKIGMKRFRTSDLLIAKKNIAIGTAYMKEMLLKFSHNHILATASYNAGPGRSVKWSPKKGCIPADIWIEQIPFNETRGYVKRVLFYASIYDWRLGNKVTPMKDRMRAIFPYQSKQAKDQLAITCPST